MRLAAPLFDSLGIKDQYFMTDQREIMLDSKILKRAFLGYDLFEKFPQRWNVPLTVTEFVNGDPFGFLPGSPECLEESFVARDNPKITIENQQRLPDRFDNALGKFSASGKPECVSPR